MASRPKFLEQTLRRVAAPVLEEGQEEVGLGDVVHGVTNRLGMKHCSKCAERKARMNKRTVFGKPR